MVRHALIDFGRARFYYKLKCKNFNSHILVYYMYLLSQEIQNNHIENSCMFLPLKRNSGNNVALFIYWFQYDEYLYSKDLIACAVNLILLNAYHKIYFYLKSAKWQSIDSPHSEFDLGDLQLYKYEKVLKKWTLTRKRKKW